VFLQWQLRVVRMKVGPSAERIKNKRWYRFEQVRNFSSACRLFVALLSAIFVAGCASFGPYHANTPDHPFNSIRGPKGSGRYQLAFIEFGDQGSNLDNSQIKAALDVIHQAERPFFLFTFTAGKTMRTHAMFAGLNIF
jgi:hypothetical protein